MSLFDQWYPLFTQRLEFLGSSRVNESKIDYAYRVIKEARRCKVSELKSEELTILKIIHGMDDSRIRKEALKEKNLDQEKLLDIIRRMDGDASVNRMYQGGNRESKSNTEVGNKSKEKVCFTCGKPGTFQELLYGEFELSYMFQL